MQPYSKSKLQVGRLREWAQLAIQQIDNAHFNQTKPSPPSSPSVSSEYPYQRLYQDAQATLDRIESLRKNLYTQTCPFSPSITSKAQNRPSISPIRKSEALYQEARVRDLSIMHRKMLQEEEQNQKCTFSPSINPFRSRRTRSAPTSREREDTPPPVSPPSPVPVRRSSLTSMRKFYERQCRFRESVEAKLNKCRELKKDLEDVDLTFRPKINSNNSLVNDIEQTQSVPIAERLHRNELPTSSTFLRRMQKVQQERDRDLTFKPQVNLSPTTKTTSSAPVFERLSRSQTSPIHQIKHEMIQKEQQKHYTFHPVTLSGSPGRGYGIATFEEWYDKVIRHRVALSEQRKQNNSPSKSNMESQEKGSDLPKDTNKYENDVENQPKNNKPQRSRPTSPQSRASNRKKREEEIFSMLINVNTKEKYKLNEEPLSCQPTTAYSKSNNNLTKAANHTSYCESDIVVNECIETKEPRSRLESKIKKNYSFIGHIGELTAGLFCEDTRFQPLPCTNVDDSSGVQILQLLSPCSMASVDSRGPRDSYGVEEPDTEGEQKRAKRTPFVSPLSDDSVSICSPTKYETVTSPSFLPTTPNPPGKMELLERYLEDGRKAQSGYMYEMENSITSYDEKYSYVEHQHDICDEEIDGEDGDLSSSSSQSSFSSLW